MVTKKQMELMSRITEHQWRALNKGYKAVIKGKKYVLILSSDKGTMLVPVKVVKAKRKLKKVI